MKCLCCGKPITNSATNVEKEWCWHKKCVKRFFQTDELPILDITKEQLEFRKSFPCIYQQILMQDLQLWTIRQDIS